MTRENLIAKTVSALHRHGFDCQTFFDSDNCFDIIARKGSTTIVLKLYENIDSIRKEQGEELRKLCSLIGASGMIVGEKTKVFQLEEGVVYYRYGIPAMAMRTFEKLLGRETPKVTYFKGRQIVELEAGKLRERRLGREFSLGELAGKIGVAPESLYRFEKGASTTLETALKLENQLHARLMREVELLGAKKGHDMEDEEPKDRLLEKMHELGIRMALFEHTPFRAYSDEEKGIFIGTGKGKFDIPKKAMELRKTSAVINMDSVIITKEYRHKSEHGVPVIEEEELSTMSKARDLRKIIREREEEKP